MLRFEKYLASFIIAGVFCLQSSLSAASERFSLASISVPNWIDGECNGFFIDILRDSYGQVGLEFDCTIVPPARQMRYLKQGIVDCAFPFPRFAVEGTELHVAEVFYKYKVAIVSINPGEISLNELVGKRVRAFTAAAEMLGPEYKKVVSDNALYEEGDVVENHLGMLLLGRVDYSVLETRALNWIIKQQMPDVALHINYQFPKLKLFGACTEKTYVEKFHAGQKALIESGGLEDIYRRHDILIE